MKNFKTQEEFISQIKEPVADYRSLLIDPKIEIYNQLIQADLN